jgi:predicted nucleotidyltransferase
MKMKDIQLRIPSSPTGDAFPTASMDSALKALKELLLEKFGAQFDSLVVFGSAARGEFSEASDVDVLIVLDLPPRGVDWRLERELRSLAFGVELEYNIVFDLHTKSTSDMRGPRSHTPFLEAVRSEGKVIV